MFDMLFFYGALSHPGGQGVAIRRKSRRMTKALVSELVVAVKLCNEDQANSLQLPCPVQSASRVDVVDEVSFSHLPVQPSPTAYTHSFLQSTDHYGLVELGAVVTPRGERQGTTSDKLPCR